jgi:hypothetical protein
MSEYIDGWLFVGLAWGVRRCFEIIDHYLL